MIVLKTIHDVEKYRKKLTAKSIGFVPTMGALHKGHESLIKTSIKTCDITIVSIYLNPKQFGPNEDLNTYPVQTDTDINICKAYKIDAVFIPTDNDIYPKNDSSTPYKPSEAITSILCGKSRPQFFKGVCNVVERLFNLIKPTHAFFGNKDLQQRLIIEQMITDLKLNITIVGCPIIRDQNGLALSSRNAYLTTETYKIVSKVPNAVRKILTTNVESAEKFIEKIKIKINEIGCSVEYVNFYNKRTKQLTNIINNDTYCCIAFKNNGIRLIDNYSMKIKS